MLMGDKRDLRPEVVEPAEADPERAIVLSEAAISALVEVSAILASGSAAELRSALRRAARLAPPAAVEECLLQSYLFLGFPAALTALSSWRDLSGLDAASVAPSGESLESWARTGEDVCRTVYGRSYDKLRGNVQRVHPDLDRWMIQEGYGKVLGRSGLDLGTRELCIVAILAATGWEGQLHSHLRGAIHAGNPFSSVERALEEGLRHADAPTWTARARDLWRRVRSAAGRAETES